ncbi:MAG: hypothetical protein ACLQVD_17975 [Capsulimonadaceae bacterium]
MGGMNPSSGQEQTWLNNGQGSIGQMNNYAASMGGFGQGALNTLYSSFVGQYAAGQQALGDYWKNLAQNGPTANQRAAFLGNFGSFTNPWNQAASNSALQMSQRGLGSTNSGAPNSVNAGASAYNQAMQAANMQQAQSALGQWQLKTQPMAYQQAAAAFGAPAQLGAQYGLDALGRAAGIYGQGAGLNFNGANLDGSMAARQNPGWLSDGTSLVNTGLDIYGALS